VRTVRGGGLKGPRGVVKGKSSMRCGNEGTRTFRQISKQVNVMVDACYNIVINKNLSIKICQTMNNSAFSFSISIDVNKKKKIRHKKSKRKEEEKNG